MDQRLCILHRRDNEIVGWIIALDIDDARRQAQSIGAHDLAQKLYTMGVPRAGKHELGSDFTMLVG